MQLYVGFPNAAVDRPVRLLRGFDKVALEPGETRTVRFRLSVRDLAWYDAASRSWKVEPMTYIVPRRPVVPDGRPRLDVAHGDGVATGAPRSAFTGGLGGTKYPQDRERQHQP